MLVLRRLLLRLKKHQIQNKNQYLVLPEHNKSNAIVGLMSLVQWNPSHGYPHKLGSTVLHKNKILELMMCVLVVPF